MANLVVCGLLMMFLLNLNSAAPIKYLTQDKQNFIERYVELLDEKGMNAVLEEPSWDAGSFMIRDKRQVEQFDETTNTEPPDQAQPGFFDRAAKFVLELLQRFLKWINSPDN